MLFRSGQLSYFFKYRINEILSAGPNGGYRAQIIYAGGDDMFIVGNWSDIIYAAKDIREALDEFTGNGALTISAGIGMFDAKYPISRMASETGELEDKAKLFVRRTGAGATKDAVALWMTENVFGWEEFIGNVLPKVREIEAMLTENEKGNSFIYRVLELLRSTDSASSIPRLAYALARSFEDRKSVV